MTTIVTDAYGDTTSVEIVLGDIDLAVTESDVRSTAFLSADQARAVAAALIEAADKLEAAELKDAELKAVDLLEANG